MVASGANAGTWALLSCVRDPAGIGIGGGEVAPRDERRPVEPGGLHRHDDVGMNPVVGEIDGDSIVRLFPAPVDGDQRADQRRREDVAEAAEQCLKRDKSWIKVSRGALTGVVPATGGKVDDVVVKKADLINTTDIRVFTDGSIDSKDNPGSAISLNGLTNPAKTFMDVFEAVRNNDGWYFDFDRLRSRNVTQAVISDQSLVFTEYQPSGLKCQPEGYGFLNAPHMQAGIPGAFAPIGTISGSTNGDGAEEVKLSDSLGLGSPSSPSIHQRGDGKKVAVVQTSTGELSTNVIESGATQGQRESWRELIISW